MNVTPEIIRAEMDYRVERAHHNAEVVAARAYRRAQRGWFRRAREHHSEHHGNGRPAAVNGASLAA